LTENDQTELGWSERAALKEWLIIAANLYGWQQQLPKDRQVPQGFTRGHQDVAHVSNLMYGQLLVRHAGQVFQARYFPKGTRETFDHAGFMCVRVYICLS